MSERGTEMTRSNALLTGIKLTAVALAFFIVLVGMNILIGVVPAKYTTLDITPNKLYTLSKQTESFLQQLDTDVTLYVLCNDSDPSVILQPFLNQFTATPRISLKTVDPKRDPDFTKQYTDTELSNFSVIVESEYRNLAIDYYDFLCYKINGHEDLGELPYATYQEMVGNQNLLIYYYQYYSINLLDATLYFCGDLVLSSAIEYVSIPELPHPLMLTEHGETPFSEELKGYLDRLGFSVTDCSLKGQSADVLSNCSVLIINDPKTDLDEDELSALQTFAANGGTFLLLTSPDSMDSLPRFSKLAAQFGLVAKSGLIHEGDEIYHTASSATEIFPIPQSGDSSSSPPYTIKYLPASNSYMMCLPGAHAIESNPEQALAGTTVQIVSQTSPSARIQIDADVVDEGGSYAVCMSSVNSQTGSLMVWYGCSDAFTDEGAVLSSFGNYVYLYTTLSFLRRTYTSSLDTLESISLHESTLDISSSNKTVWIVVSVILIPGAIIGVGTFMWIRRKKQ